VTTPDADVDVLARAHLVPHPDLEHVASEQCMCRPALDADADVWIHHPLDAELAAALTAADDDRLGRRPVETRWEMDAGMVAAVLASPKSSRRITDMRAGDRAWIVAGLELSGEAAERTAERMWCSLRLIRSLRAEDATQMARLLQAKISREQKDLRAEQCAHGVTRCELAEALRANARLQMQVDQLVDRLTTTGKVDTFPRCGHPVVPYNTYEHDGRRWCRQCRRDKQAERRRTLSPAV